MHDSRFAENEQPTEPAQSSSGLLSEVATTLLRVPFQFQTSELHIRALRLKRQIDLWASARPTDEEARAMRKSIVALRNDVAGCLSTR